MPWPSKHFQAESTLLSIVEPFPHARSMSLADLERIRQRTHIWTHEYLERLAAGVQQQGVLVRKVTIDGRPHTRIAENPEASQVALIVMSTREQSGLSRWLMGSVADRVVCGGNMPPLPRDQWGEAKRIRGSASKSGSTTG
jgi:nucleotide-binding universal stress UspA family protein